MELQQILDTFTWGTQGREYLSYLSPEEDSVAQWCGEIEPSASVDKCRCTADVRPPALRSSFVGAFLHLQLTSVVKAAARVPDVPRIYEELML